MESLFLNTLLCCPVIAAAGMNPPSGGGGEGRGEEAKHCPYNMKSDAVRREATHISIARFAGAIFFKIRKMY